MARVKMRIVGDDLAARVSKALETRMCGDMEVLRYLARNNLVYRWERIDDGEVKSFKPITMKCAFEQGFEVRPDPQGIAKAASKEQG